MLSIFSVLLRGPDDIKLISKTSKKIYIFVQMLQSQKRGMEYLIFNSVVGFMMKCYHTFEWISS